MRLSAMPHASSLVLPVEWERKSISSLLDAMCLVSFQDSGFPILSPIIHRILLRIIADIRILAERRGFLEGKLPLVEKRVLLERSGKYDRFRDECLTLEAPFSDLTIASTTEEVILEYLEHGGLESFRQLPLRMLHFCDLVRGIKRVRHLYASRQMSAAVFSSFDADDAGYRRSLAVFRDLCSALWERWGIPVNCVIDRDETSVEYVFQSMEGDRPIASTVAVRRSHTGDSSVFHSGSSTERYASLAMGYRFEQTSAFSVGFTDSYGRRQLPVFGTFGIGLQRCLYALFELLRTRTGIPFPATVRPFDAAVIPADTSDAAVMCESLQVYRNLLDAGVVTMIDDRHNPTLSARFKLADFLGVPVRLIIGKNELAKGTVELRTGCVTSLRRDVPQSDVAEVVTNAVRDRGGN